MTYILAVIAAAALITLYKFFPSRKIFGTILVFAGKFACHFISGVIFFASYAPEGTSPIIYSLVTNAMLIVPEAIICCVILKFLPVQRLLDAMKD